MLHSTVPTIFSIDAEYDLVQLWLTCRDADEEGLLGLATDTGVDISIFKNAHGASSTEDAQRILRETVEHRYVHLATVLENARTSYQHSWDEIGPSFYRFIQEKTGVPWEFPEYEVILSLFLHGISNRGQNFVLRSALEPPDFHTRITAHEILMIQLWHIFEQRFGKETVDTDQRRFWMLNEITAAALLGLEPEMNRLWHPQQRGFDGFLLNYPEMTGMKTRLKMVYERSTSFGGYLKESIGAFRNAT